MKRVLVFLVLLSVASFVIDFDIGKEELSLEELSARVKVFNNWFHTKYPDYNYLEARVNADGLVRTYTTRDIKEDDVFLKLQKDMVLRNVDIYSTKYSESLREAEEFYGYDDITNFALLLIAEKHNPESQWKPYLDLLPAKPHTLLYDYWNNKLWVEHNLGNISLASKLNLILKSETLFERRLFIEKKARGINDAFIGSHSNIFDKDVFTVANIEWALLTVESKAQFVNWEAFLIPMYDFVTYGSHRDSPHKIGESNLSYEPFSISFKAMANFKADDPILVNPKLPNSKILQSYAQVVKDSAFDCFALTLSFSSRSEDTFSKKRIDFFSKYFLFDQSHYDVM